MIERISIWLARLGGALILLSAIHVSIDVALRNLFTLTVMKSFEITTYSFAIAVAAGMAYALHQRAHIRIEALYRLVPAAPRRLLDALAALGIVVFALTLLWYAAGVVLESATNWSRSNSSLAVPLAFPQGLWLIGLGWFAVAAVWILLSALAAFVRRRADRFDDLISIPSPEAEIKASTETQRKSEV